MIHIKEYVTINSSPSRFAAASMISVQLFKVLAIVSLWLVSGSGKINLSTVSDLQAQYLTCISLFSFWCIVHIQVHGLALISVLFLLEEQVSIH